jgi:siroheme synthase (precorrin-2 oxidase/ferrochelatase)
MIEEWRKVKGFEEHYEISNFGFVRSNWRKKPAILKPSINGVGYYHIILSKDTKQYTIRIHQLVAIAFLNHERESNLVVDHKDNNPLNNRVDNLQLVTRRLNNSKDRKNKTSQYTGVSWNKKDKKWRAGIKTNGKSTNLGSFICELDASNAYQKALNNTEELRKYFLNELK